MLLCEWLVCCVFRLIFSQTECLLADLIVGWTTETGPKHVSGLVIDNAAAMKKARQQVVATEGFTHISEMR